MTRRATKYLSPLAFLVVLQFSVSIRPQEASAQFNVPTLPEPLGPFGVGRVAFDWVDPNRTGDMAEDRGPHSELMVYLWYPTEAPIREVKSTLFPGAKQIDSSPDFSPFLKAKVFGGNWPRVV